MSNIVNLFRNGGQMIEDMDVLLGQVSGIEQENQVLKTLVEKQGAIIVAIKDELGVISRKMDELQDTVKVNTQSTNEIKTTEFIGKKPKFLPSLLDEAKTLNPSEIRKIIRKAARNQ